ICWLALMFWSTRATYWLVLPPEGAAAVKLFNSAVLVGMGMNFSSTNAAGLMDAAGMVLAANFVRPQFFAKPVVTKAVLTLSGSKMRKSAGKTPLRPPTVGTVVVKTDDARWRYPS